MAVETPTINCIIKMTEFDLYRTKVQKFNMYMCLDTQRLYYDSTDYDVGRIVYNYIGVKTVNDLMYNITPEFGKTYYCWEDNSLWTWMNKWIVIFSDSTYPSAYSYDDWNGNTGALNPVYRYDEPLMPADDNGLLHDGSVVIRDRNRIIKGKLYIDDGNDNLVISSYLGGGLRFLPNGLLDTDGELYIDDEGHSFLRSELTIKNNEIYVNYSEEPGSDPASGTSLEKPSHNYKVYHEGNLDASLLQPITGQLVYNALITDKASLPNPFDFNVKKLDGHPLSDFSLTGHTHTASDITDFNQQAQAQAEVTVKSILNNIVGEGITVTTPQTASDNYKISADNFVLRFSGGATGNGTIRHLGDTTIVLTVDPSEHIHQDLIDMDTNLQNQINAIITIDPSNYYNKTQVDNLIAGVEGTAVPTANKPLLVNSNLEFDINVTSASKFKNSKHIELTGDITGSVDTDFTNNTVSITTDASNIISSVATTGKAVLVDANGDLPVNATSSSQLNHTIAVSLTGEATGTATLDTSTNTLNIQTALVPGNNILQSSDLNILVPELENVGTSANPQYKIKIANIPSVLLETTIKPQGTFDPTQGVPSVSPEEGYIWEATTEGTISGVTIQAGDFYLYLNSQWNLVSGNQNVISINNQQGRVTLTNTDVNAISDSYINYTIGQTIPANKIPVTDSAGHLSGVKVDALTNTHSFITTNGDVAVNTSSSTRTATDGSQDFDVQLDITQAGYQNILDKIGYVLQKNNVDLTHKKKLNFSSGLDVTATTNVYSLKVSDYLNQFNWIYLPNGGTISRTTPDYEELLDNLKSLYDNKNNKPVIIVIGQISHPDLVTRSSFNMFIMDTTTPNSATSTTITLYGLNEEQTVTSVVSNSYKKLVTNRITLGITFDSNGDISSTSKGSSTNVANDINFLPIDDATGITTAFVPTQNYQPASKKYVDDNTTGRIYKTTIGDGVNTSFNVTHNLGTRDIIVQFRDTTTNQQVYLDNDTLTTNVLHITSNTLLASGQVQVIIMKC